MNKAADSPSAPKPRVTAQDRAARRLRIFARFQEGRSYEAIAREEGLTRERVRQIIVEDLDARKAEPNGDHTRLQMARLEPALRLAAEKVASGDLRAVGHLIKVLDRLDKYQRADGMTRYEEDADAEAFDRKLADLVRRSKEAQAEREAAAAGEKLAPAPEDGAGGTRNAISKFFRP